MKVVMFPGYGVRMGETTQRIPKPMIPVDTQPILWHIMKWCASWRPSNFLLCFGYRADAVKKYFLGYDEAPANYFALDRSEVQLLGGDMDDWRITFLDKATKRRSGTGCWRRGRTLRTRRSSSRHTATVSPTLRSTT